MRPLRMEIEGFTCFRETVTIEFDDVHLFALSGRTGAGKTSILDAMIFALFGAVPRKGGTHGLGDLVSLGLGRARIVLDFRVGKDAYRVARVVRRQGANRAQFERLEGDAVVGIADQVKTVGAEVERVLGLDYHAFIRSVMLPQGEFALFLRSRPGERRKILERLLRHHVYALMARSAAEREAKLGRDVEHGVRVLEREYGAATKEAVAALEATVESLDLQIREAQPALDRLGATLTSLQRRRAHTVELLGARRARGELGTRSAEISALRDRLDAAARAENVRSVIERHRRVMARHEQCHASLAEAQKALGEAQVERDAAQVQADRAKARARERDELAARLDALEDAVEFVLPQLDEARSECERLRGRVRSETAALDGHRERVTEHETTVASLDDKIGALEAVLGEKFDGALHQRLRAARERLEALRRDRMELSKDGIELGDSERELALSEEALEERAEAMRLAGQALERATATATALRAEVEEILRSDAAQHLREHLRIGEPCPVCDQLVDRSPNVRVISELVAPRAELEQVEATLAGLQRAATAAQTAFVSTEAAVVAERKAIAKLRSTVEGLAKAAATEEAALADQLRIVVEPDDAIEDAALELLRTMDTQRAERDLREKDLAARRIDRERAGELLEGSERDVAKAVDEVARLERSLREKTGREQELADRLAEVTDAEDPRAAREDLRVAIAALDSEISTSDTRLGTASTAFALAERDVESRSADERRAADELADVTAQLSDGLARAGFADAAACEAAFIDRSVREQHEHELSSHRDAVRANEAEIARLAGQLSDGEVDEAQVDGARRALDAAREEHQRQSQELGGARERLATLVKQCERASEIEASLQEDRRQHAVFSQLALDLQIDRFRAWLLEGAFEDLCAGASVRLRELSDRYTLDYDGEHFCVVDHDNAEEVRPADTLSGGETFLASLALALELSEQIQRSSGAVRLESLFIDEGFGTLDSESLETVAEAIETLPRAGRLVGIVTHIEDLTRRLPHRIEVIREAGGSRVQQSSA